MVIDLEEIEALAKAALTAEKAYPTPGKHPTLEGIEIQQKLDALYAHMTAARTLEMVEELRRLRDQANKDVAQLAAMCNETVRLRGQVDHWERKEMTRAVCCAENEEQLAITRELVEKCRAYIVTGFDRDGIQKALAEDAIHASRGES